MTAFVVPSDGTSLGPGILYRFVIGTTIPTMAATAGQFSDAWPAAYVPVGVTRDGSTFSYETTSEDIVVAEYLDPLDTVETGRNIGVAFDLARILDASYKLAFNGGSTTTVSGTGATLVSKFNLPTLGNSVKTGIAWESQDGTQRFFFYECLQSGNISWSNSKAPNYQSLPLTFKVTQPNTGDPFNPYFAGPSRIAA
jgi:hypothetical protein